MEVVYNKKDSTSFIHYSGIGINLNILLVSSHIKDKKKRGIIEDPGSRHRIINSFMIS